jgi:hypothetical protein
MGHNNNWNTIVVLVLLISSCSVLTKQKTPKIRSLDIYFIVQIDSIVNDTFFFETIEIYTNFPTQKIGLYDSEGNKLPVAAKHSLLVERKINSGNGVRIKKSDLSKLVILQSHIYKIQEDGFIEFENRINPKRLNLSELYKFPNY